MSYKHRQKKETVGKPEHIKLQNSVLPRRCQQREEAPSASVCKSCIWKGANIQGRLRIATTQQQKQKTPLKNEQRIDISPKTQGQ